MVSSDSQSQERPIPKIYEVVNSWVPNNVRKRRNRLKDWKYGYDKEYDLIVISKTGRIGDIYLINGLYIALPLAPELVEARSRVRSEQYWERDELPVELDNIKTVFEWNNKPESFKSKWINYIDEQFEKREHGTHFLNNGVSTYITGSHWMYLQWSSIDVGYPDYREANRILYIFWEACKADPRSYGMIYLKIRRSGFSYMFGSEMINQATITAESKYGILSKTGKDAKELFTDKVVPVSTKYPFFFKPIQDGMDKPKTELAYRMPASKLTKKNMKSTQEEDGLKGLNTVVAWLNTGDNSFDGWKLKLLLHDESGKWLKPDNVKNNWKVTKTCLRIGRKIIGKCAMGSTCNALKKGGAEFKDIYYSSDPRKRSANGQTVSGLYSFFIPMEWNMEGFIDRYGMPVFYTPREPVMGIDGEMIEIGAIDFWQNEVDSLKDRPDDLNEFYRQFPRTEAHAFRDESKSSIFDLTRIYEQIDFNDTFITERHITRGNFTWHGGVKDSRVVWEPNPRGRFLISWVPPYELQSRVVMRNGVRYPGSEHIGAFGCDSYDISGTVDGRGSKGALHGLTKFNMESAPSNEFFLEYIARPDTAEIFYEDVLMAIVFYGMPLLAENNKPRLLYHIKNRGYRGFSMNRPDRPFIQLSKTERELGGIPMNSEDIKQAHATAIETYIVKHVGIDHQGTYREQGEIGNMPFNKTLLDWAAFDINDRTKFDASISSGLAIMANQKHVYLPEKKQSKINVNFARYDNNGTHSRIITDER